MHTKVNKIKVGGFSYIYNEIIPKSYRTIKEIQEFKENISKILNTPLKSEKLLCSLMVWFMREHMPTETIYKLLGNSANAKYTRIETSNPSNPDDKADLIFKFQIKDESDDLVIDILNTRLINKLFIGEEKSSFMVYTESFMTYIDSTNSIFNLEKYKQKIIEGPINTQLDLLAVKCMVVENIKYNQVHENLSLKSLFKIIEPNEPLKKITTLNLINIQLDKLFKDLQMVGELYGFVHNDCHLGNIFINSNNQLVLIDMGRVYFNFNAKIVRDASNINVQRSKKQRIEESTKLHELYSLLIEEENQKFTEIDYKEPYNYEKIIQNIKTKKTDKKPTYINPFYTIGDIKKIPDGKNIKDYEFLYEYYVKNMYLFDLSTIVMNILYYSITNKDCEYIEIIQNNETQSYNYRQLLLEYFDKDNRENEDVSLLQNIFISKDVDGVKIELTIFKNDSNLLRNKYNLGIYIFAIFVLYVIKFVPECFTELAQDQPQDELNISENTIVLKKNKNESYTLEIYYTHFVEETYSMWHSYQYINIPKIYMFYGYFYNHKEIIEKLKPSEQTQGQQGGRVKCTQMSKIPASFNVNTNLHEIIDNTFPIDLPNILGNNKLQDDDFKYKNDTIPNTVPVKARRFYEPESETEIFKNYIPHTNATLYSEIDELFKNHNTAIISYKTKS